jgi:uncharacterized protein
MDKRTVLGAIHKYLTVLQQEGIQVDQVILFGSHARSAASPDSDIDLIVISHEFDDPVNKKAVNLLWEVRAKTDSRIEPVAVGRIQWQEEDSSPLLEIARREGEEIPFRTIG